MTIQDMQGQDREWFRVTSGQGDAYDFRTERVQDDNQDREWFRMTIRTGSG